MLVSKSRSFTSLAPIRCSLSAFSAQTACLSTTSSNDVAGPLFDTFGRYHDYLRISLTEKCNLRCQYCMPEDGIELSAREQLMTLDERKRLITMFAKLGIRKLRFTGGEPTISNQLAVLVAHARNCGIESVGITSNGIVLRERLEALVLAGLTSVNISLDTLVEDKFGSITRRDKGNLRRVMSSIYSAVGKGLPVKINCVLMRGFNDMEIAQFVDLTREVPVDCRFIELMPFDGNAWSPEKFVSYMEILDRLKFEDNLELRREQRLDHDANDTTKWYRVHSSGGYDYEKGSRTNAAAAATSTSSTSSSSSGGEVSTLSGTGSGTGSSTSSAYAGRVGFITSMSSHFCGTCNRLRVTADGQLKVCLFGADGLNILSLMRDGYTDKAIIEQLGQAVKQKKAALGGHTTASDIASHSEQNRPMILIGG